MTGILDGRTALVTGGAAGIGASIADALAGAGARVAITYLTHEPKGDHLSVKLDATVEADVAAAVAQVGEAFGHIDILVNNAGGLVQRALIADMSFELWRDVMALNLDSAFLVTHYALKYFSTPHGRIINLSSVAGRNGGNPGATAYATSKSALFAFTRGLAKELAPRGITVNALAPGFIEDTPFHERYTSAEVRAHAVDSIPVGRVGYPADVTTAALWLAQPDTDFITGTIVDMNGGQYFG